MGKKRKKKTYTKPKKVKKTNVNVPLHTLKYFKITDDKIIYLREKCKVCDSFCAIHKDRMYCGFCEQIKLY
jgi:small subunit ribosomal protein S27Ae